jgi:hypothetical protein
MLIPSFGWDIRTINILWYVVMENSNGFWIFCDLLSNMQFLTYKLLKDNRSYFYAKFFLNNHVNYECKT